MKTYIYSMICPLSGQITYIGKANNVERRILDHVKDQRNISVDKMLWLDRLKQAKLKPDFEILDEVSLDNWKFWESFYIEYFKSYGVKLLNKGQGQGLSFANSQTFKKGQCPHNYGKKLINGHYE